jgi:hypothetical protein
LSVVAQSKGVTPMPHGMAPPTLGTAKSSHDATAACINSGKVLSQEWLACPSEPIFATKRQTMKKNLSGNQRP